MKKQLKKAFTLTELLITLAIIGVVAAITIPQLFGSMQKKVAKTSLSRAVEQIELGCQNMIQAENDKITDGSYIDMVSAISDFSSEKLATFIGASEVTYEDNSKAYKFQKFQADVKFSNNAGAANTDNPDAIIMDLTIDANGTDKKPNQDNYDIFEYELTNNCKMKLKD